MILLSVNNVINATLSRVTTTVNIISLLPPEWMFGCKYVAVCLTVCRSLPLSSCSVHGVSQGLQLLLNSKP